MTQRETHTGNNTETTGEGVRETTGCWTQELLTSATHAASEALSPRHPLCPVQDVNRPFVPNLPHRRSPPRITQRRCVIQVPLLLNHGPKAQE